MGECTVRLQVSWALLGLRQKRLLAIENQCSQGTTEGYVGYTSPLSGPLAGTGRERAGVGSQISPATCSMQSCSRRRLQRVSTGWAVEKKGMCVPEQSLSPARGSCMVSRTSDSPPYPRHYKQDRQHCTPLEPSTGKELKRLLACASVSTQSMPMQPHYSARHAPFFCSP